MSATLIPLRGLCLAALFAPLLFAQAPEPEPHLAFRREVYPLDASAAPRLWVRLFAILPDAQWPQALAWPEHPLIASRQYVEGMGLWDVEASIGHPEGPTGARESVVADYVLGGGTEALLSLPAFQLPLSRRDGGEEDARVVPEELASGTPRIATRLQRLDFCLDTRGFPQAEVCKLIIRATAMDGGVLELERLIRPSPKSGGRFEDPIDRGYEALERVDTDGGSALALTRRFEWPLRRALGDQEARRFHFPEVLIACDQVRFFHEDAAGKRELSPGTTIILDAGEGVSPFGRLMIFASTFTLMLTAVVSVLIMGLRRRARALREGAGEP